MNLAVSQLPPPLLRRSRAAELETNWIAYHNATPLAIHFNDIYPHLLKYEVMDKFAAATSERGRIRALEWAWQHNQGIGKAFASASFPRCQVKPWCDAQNARATRAACTFFNATEGEVDYSRASIDIERAFASKFARVARESFSSDMHHLLLPFVLPLAVLSCAVHMFAKGGIPSPENGRSVHH